MIHDNGWTEIYVLNVGVAWWNTQIFMAYPQYIALHTQISILNASFSILLPKNSIFYLQKFSSILSQENGIFDSKSPQNSVIFDKDPQAPLAPLAVFSRSDCGISAKPEMELFSCDLTSCYLCQSFTYLQWSRAW